MSNCCFFVVKRKTAYEVRISDWSSDVCSSDLAQLRNLGAAAVLNTWIRGKAEAIGPEHRAGMNDNAIPQRDTVIKRNAGIQQALLTHHRVRAHDATRAKTSAPADAGTVFEYAMRPYADIVGDPGRGRDDRGGVNSSRTAGGSVKVEPLRQPGVHQVRLASQDDVSEQRRVGKACVRTWRSRWSP